MKKSSIILLSFLLLTSLFTIPAEATTRFDDIPSNYWANEEIQFLTGTGIIKGYSDGTFEPGAHITRQQAAIMLSRALNLSLSNRPNPQFKDVTSKLTGYKEISAIVDEGIFTNQTYFYPNQNLTRGEMAKALVVGYKISGTSGVSFVDVTSENPYYTYINLIAESGVTNGFSDQTFRPNNPITRAEFSSFLYRIIHNSNINSTPSPTYPNQTNNYKIVDDDNNLVTTSKARDDAITVAINNPGTKVIPPDNKGFIDAAETNINNGVLVYNGFETDSKIAKEGKFPEHFFDSYVAYEKDGQYVDRFFDTFIILGLRYPEGIFQQSFKLNTSDYSDWTWYLNRTFNKEGAIARLNESALTTKVGTAKVYMAIPYPKNHYTFTTPDGRIDEVNNESRLEIVKWYIDEVENQIRLGEYKGIQLDGFYWINETINLTEDEALLKEVSQYIHSKGYKFIFSPHSGAANLQNWKKYGFDAPYLQSNAFKIRDNHDNMVRKLHDGYIRALQNGTAVSLEIENSGPNDVDISFQNLRSYLELGHLYNLQGKSMIMYQGTEMIYRLTKSIDPEYREMYDELYDFFSSNR